MRQPRLIFQIEANYLAIRSQQLFIALLPLVAISSRPTINKQ